MGRRSRAYPSEDVSGAFQILLGPLSALDTEPRKRDELARMLGYSSSSGGNAARRIAALVHYGLVDRRGGRYTVSAFGRYVRTLEPNSREWQAAMREAFQRPAIFNEVLARSRDDGRLPPDLESVLESELGVTPNACKTVARVFKDSGMVAGVLEPDGSLKTGQALSKVAAMRPRSVKPLPREDRGRADEPQDTAESSPPRANRAETLTCILDSVTCTLDYGEAEVSVRVPETISEDDVERLEQYFHVLVKTARKRAQRRPTGAFQSVQGSS